MIGVKSVWEMAKNPGALMASGGLTFIFRLAGLGLNFAVMMIITNWYGDGIYGNYSLAFTLAQACALVCAMGFPNALIGYIGLRPVTDPFSQHLFHKGLKFLLLVSIVPITLFFLGADLIAIRLFENAGLGIYIKIIAVTVPAMVLHEFVLYFFIATGNFVKYNLFMFIIPNAILLLLLAIFTGVPGHYTFLFYLSSITGVLLIEVFFAIRKINTTDFDKVPIRGMIKYASPMMFSGLMIYLLNWTDIFMLGAMVSEDEVGQYNGAYKIASLGMLVITSVNIVLAPQIASFFKRGDYAAMHRLVRKTTHLIIALTLPLAGGIIAFSDFLLGLLGEEFRQARGALILISAGVLVNAFTGTVDQVLNMTGHQQLLRNITIAGFTLNVFLNLMLIPAYGINGAAIASLATNVSFNLLCVIYIKKKLGFYTFA
jgi:O-antigen/teichoic acid export membrane protein